jgi:phenylalanyl-tRNA synthetase beta chain
MKFLRSWLAEHIDISHLSTQQLADAITHHSSEVETVEIITDWFGGLVRVGKITNLRKHDNADKLNVFEVDLGASQVTIVSAAPNVAEGMLVPVALIGAKLAEITIAERPMRGVVSQGMCCGKSELLQEAEFSSGLWELDCGEDSLGKSICEVYPELFPHQDVLDIKILPDRIGNIGNYIGLSIEVARILGNPELLQGTARLIYYGEFGYVPATFKKDDQYQINMSDTTGLSMVFDLFRARLSSAYTLPLTIKQQLFFVGSNLVNPLADLSNYIMYVTGQPVHFFSSKKVFADASVRNWSIQETTQPEEFVGLGNLKKTTIPSGILVLKDDTTILTIPALTGGESTKVDEEDTDVIIEVPYFDAMLTMRNSFRMKYRSEGAKVWASRSHGARIGVALSLLNSTLSNSNISIVALTTKGIQETTTLTEHLEQFHTPTVVDIDWDYIASRWDKQHTNTIQSLLTPQAKLLGVLVDKQLTIKNQAYNFVEDDNTLLTELSYLHGVNEIQGTSLVTTQIPPYRNTDPSNLLVLKQRLTSLGLDEVMTRPFVSEGQIQVLKSQNENMNYMRTNLWQSLLAVAGTNYASGIDPVRVFEINKLYTTQDSVLNEARMLCICIIEQDPYQASAIAHSILSWTGTQEHTVTTTQVQDSLGHTTTYSHGSTNIKLTEVSNSHKKTYNLPLKKRVWILQYMISQLPQLSPLYNYTDISTYPEVVRDYTIAIPTDTVWSTILHIVTSIPADFHKHIIPVARMNTDQLDNLTFRVTLQSSSKTLTPHEILDFERQMLAEIATQVAGAILPA